MPLFPGKSKQAKKIKQGLTAPTICMEQQWQQVFYSVPSSKHQRHGANVTKLFSDVMCEFSQYVRVFVPGKPSQLSLMFVSEA